MSERDFLRRLSREGRLEIVQPREEIKISYLKKSESYLVSAKLLLGHEHSEEAVPLVYYSMYYSVTALLFRTGIKCENHAAAIILLRELFGIDESALEKAKRERIDTQYFVDSTVTRLDVEDLIRAAETFNSRLLDVIDRLGNKEISRYRSTLKTMLVT